MKRRIATGLVALVVAIIVWRSAARSAPRAPAARGSAAEIAGAKRTNDPRQQAHATITGRISAAGKPVAHAHVCADGITNALLGDLIRDAICTDSDPSGAYELPDLLATEYRVTANARGLRPATSKLRLAAGARSTVDLALAAGGVEVAGTVADISGGPIAHAQLRAGDAVGETNDAGAFSLWVEPGDVSVDATAEGYAPASWHGTAPDHAELRMTPESSLAGTVVMASGDPLAGASVEVSGVDWRQPTVIVTTGDDGAFHADRLAPGRYTITVRSAHAYGTSEGSVLVALAEHTDGIVISVVPAFEITGKVTTEDGTPCPHAYLHLADEDHARSLYASGEDDGAVELGGLLPGTYHVTAGCSDYVAREGSDVEIKDKDISGAWTVKSGASVHGRVTLHDGSPVEGANINIQGSAWGVATTAADGTYRIAGLVAGSYSITTASTKGLQTAATAIELSDRENAEHDIELDPAGGIKGLVVDNGGMPIAGAFVRPSDVYGSATTGPDGTFTIAPLPPGDHDLVVELANRVMARPGEHDPENPQPVAHVWVEGNATATVRIVVDADTTEIRGVVLDGNGSPARDVMVELSTSSADGDRPMLTGDDGAFWFPAVRGARYHIHAYAAGRGEAAVDAEPGEPLELRLTSTEISGVVRGAPEEVTVTMSGQLYRTETFFRTGGKFTLHDLRPGSYTLVFDTATGHAERSLEIGDTPAAPLDVELDTVFTLTGRVVASDTHGPISGATVQLRIGSQAYPDTGAGVQTDGAGRFTIKRVHQGTANVRVTRDGRETWLEKTITGPVLDDVVLGSPPPPMAYDDYGDSFGEE